MSQSLLKLRKKLKSIEVMAKPTIWTMDMGIEFMAASSKGAVNGMLGLYGQWPAYGPFPFNSEELDILQKAIIQKKFKPELFEVMKIEPIMTDIIFCFDYHPNEFNKKEQQNFLKKFIKSILDMQLHSKDEFYVYFDKFQQIDLPLLFKSRKDLAEYFMSCIEGHLESWDEMDKWGLQEWSELIDDYNSFYTYHD